MSEHCEGHQDMVVQMTRGAEHFKQIKEDLGEVLGCIKDVQEKQSGFERRMFVDNGQPCIQTRLIHLETHKTDNEKRALRHERLLRVVFAMLIALFGKVLYSAITG